jgi:hypothetical protein
MKKILRYSLVALLAVMGFGNAMAQDDVVIDFNAMDLATSNGASDGVEASTAGDITETKTITVGNVEVIISPKEEGNKNENRFWKTSNGPQLRCYSGTITIKSTETMKSIAFAAPSKFSLTAATGTIENKTWTGEATEVVFTVTANTQINKITISVGEGGTTPEPQPTETLTVAKALEIIEALENGAKTTEEYEVKGFVTSVTEISTAHGNATFVIADTKGGETGLTVFRVKGFKGANIINDKIVAVDDEVVVKGLLQKYVKDEVVTPELAQGGQIVSVNGKTEDDTPNPEDNIKEGTLENPMTVDQALAYIAEFADGFATSKQYYVKGAVTAITEISTEFGNATFDMGGLTAYRMKGLENNVITAEDYIAVGDELIVLAKLKRQQDDQEYIPQLTSGYIYSLNGKTKEEGTEPGPVEFEGDGTKDNPYTVADLKQMKEDSYPAEAVWVKGVIIGAAKSGTALETEKEVVSNIAIAVSADAEEFVPVELKKDTEFRTNLNIVDNPDNIGKSVMLLGAITKYFSVTGVKNLEDYVLEGGETIKGDLSGDGKVNALDIQMIINACVAESTDAVFDINKDGNVNALDIQEVINIAAAAE